MATVVLAWELGAGHGHAVPLAALGRELLRRGHQVHFVWKDLGPASAVLGDLMRHPAVGLWQAPLAPPPVAGPAGAGEAHTAAVAPASHAELLLQFAGFQSADALLTRTVAWGHVLTRCAADLVVADHAPTALLAARCLGRPGVPFGAGFMVPPDGAPWPAFRSADAAPPARLAAAEAQVLGVCNQVLAGFGAPPLPRLAALYPAEHSAVVGWPELDHYRGLRPSPVAPPFGPLPLPRWAASPPWPAGGGPKLFAALQRDHGAVEVAIAALRAGPWRVLLHVGGATPAEAARWASPTLALTAGRVDLGAVLDEANAVVCHASVGTTYAGLQAGRPLVMLPLHIEHLLLAQQVSRSGAGVVLWPQEVAGGLAAAVNAVLSSPGFAAAACALRDRHRATDASSLTRLADHCEARLRPAAR